MGNSDGAIYPKTVLAKDPWGELIIKICSCTFKICFGYVNFHFKLTKFDGFAFD